MQYRKTYPLIISVMSFSTYICSGRLLWTIWILFVICLLLLFAICDEFMPTSVFLSSLLVMPCLGLAPRSPTFLLSAHLSPLFLLKLCIFTRLTSHATVTRSPAPVLGSVYGKWAAPSDWQQHFQRAWSDTVWQAFAGMACPACSSAGSAQVSTLNQGRVRRQAGRAHAYSSYQTATSPHLGQRRRLE